VYNANDKFMPWCENQQSSQDANPPNTLHISCKLSCCTQHSTADLCWIAFDVMSNTIESNVAWTTALKRFWVVDWQWHLCIFGLASGKVHFADLPDELLCDSGKVAAATDSRYKSQALAWQSATSTKLSANTTCGILYGFCTAQCFGQGDQPNHKLVILEN